MHSSIYLYMKIVNYHSTYNDLQNYMYLYVIIFFIFKYIIHIYYYIVCLSGTIIIHWHID